MVDFLVQKIDRSIGEECFRQKRVAAGIKYFEQYLSEIKKMSGENPDDALLKNELTDAENIYNYWLFENAKIAFNEKHWIKSLTCCKKLLERGFQETSIYKYTSLIYRHINQPGMRLKFAIKYFETEKDDKDINRFMGDAYFDSEDDSNMSRAIDFYKRHLEKFPQDFQAYNKIGHIYASSASLQNTQMQLEYFNKAYELAPAEKTVIKNLILTYSRMNQPDKAYELYERLKKTGMSNDDYFDFAAFCIKHRDFKNGFKYYSYRFKKETNPTFYPEIKKKKWNGKEDIKSKTLLVHAEQGFGDVIMFSRFIPEMKKYAKKVISVVQDELLPLMQTGYPDIEFFGIKNSNLDELNFDCHIPLLDLPSVLKLEPETIPCKAGYLTVKSSDVSAYKKAFLSDDSYKGKLKIAISFEGYKSPKGQNRDVDIKYFVPLSNLKAVQLFGFNKQRDDYFYKKFGDNISVINLAGTFQNFADTASALMNMDLVISSDNVVLNLAGALGLKTFGLFNVQNEYRWFDLPDSTGWYNSIKPFVAKKMDGWDDVICRVIREIEQQFGI